MKYTSIGGQAVMEGVMMRSQNSMAMSVRRSDGSIVTEKTHLNRKPWRKTVAKIPLVRGVVAFVESLIQGMRITTRSAEMYGEDALKDEEPTKFEKWLSEKFNIKVETVAMVFGVILGLALFAVACVKSILGDSSRQRNHPGKRVPFNKNHSRFN